MNIKTCYKCKSKPGESWGVDSDGFGVFYLECDCGCVVSDSNKNQAISEWNNQNDVISLKDLKRIMDRIPLEDVDIPPMAGFPTEVTPRTAKYFKSELLRDLPLS